MRRLLLLPAFVGALAGIMAAQSRNLDIYWIDVEGGAATLIVSPSGDSLLYDAGYAVDDRDAKRNYAVTKQAGLKKSTRSCSATTTPTMWADCPHWPR
jgi:beta-lactamase superfamily II metal-dependent hydrolase